MVLRLDPRIPVVWRTPDSLQLGIARAPIRLDSVTLDDELLIDALRRGVTRAGLNAIAEVRGVRAETVERLLVALEPALERTGGTASARSDDVGAGALVLGSGALAEGVAESIAAAGYRPDAGPLRLVVLTAAWLVTPEESGRWLRRDVPHLPVICSDGAVSVGPFVRPGQSACLHCLDLYRIDADPAWPAIAGQLLDLPAPALPRLALAEALALGARTALRALRGQLDAGLELRLDLASGTVTERAWAPHPECRCSTPPGIDWANADGRCPPVLGTALVGTSSARAVSARG